MMNLIRSNLHMYQQIVLSRCVIKTKVNNILLGWTTFSSQTTKDFKVQEDKLNVN